MFFLRDRSPDHIGLPERKSCKPAENLNHLLLIDDTAVCHFKYRPQQFMLVRHPFRMLRAFNKSGDGIHGPWPVKCYNGAYIFYAFCPDAGADACHTGAFQLKYAAGVTLGKHFKSGSIVFRDLFYRETGLFFPYKLCGIFEDRKVPQTKKIHLQQTELFQRGHRILADDRFIVFGQRDIFHHGIFSYHDTCRMSGSMSRHTLECFGNIDEMLHFLIVLIHLPERFGNGESFIKRHVQCHGDLLSHSIGFGVTHGKHSAYIPYGTACRQSTECDDLSNMVAAVETVHIVDNLSPAVYTEIDVDIRHGDAFGIEKAFKEQAVLYRIDICDVQTVGNHTAGCAAAPGTDGYAVVFRISNEVGDNKEIINKTHLADHIQLIIELRMNFRSVRETFGKSLFAQAAKIFKTVCTAFGQLKAGKMIMSKFKVKAALFSDPYGIICRFRQFREKRAHFLFGFKVEFICFKAQAGRIVYGFLHLDAHQHILIIGILLFHVVGIICKNQRDPGILVEPDKSGCGLIFFRDTMLLDFQIEAVFSKQFSELQCTVSCGFIVSADQ